jgi:hypothetical protein
MPAQSIDPQVNKWRQQPAVEEDAHGDTGEECEECEGELDLAHRAITGLTART